MFKNLMLLILISITFSNCKIVGNYYLINSCKSNVIVNIELSPQYMLLKKRNIDIRISKYENKKVKFSSFKKMPAQLISVDPNVLTVQFELPSNHFAYIGTNFNVKDIGEITLLENNQVHELDLRQAKFKTRGLMKYVVLYEHE